MSNESFNKALWTLQQDAGWAFWVPFIIYGIVILWHLYRLSAAETTLGRVIRVTLALACFFMIFIPAFNGLGGYAFHLLGLSVCMMVRQQYVICKLQGKIKPPESETVLGRVVERMVDKPKVNA